MQKSASVIKALKSYSSPAKAKASSWFFKTQKGQYGYGDIFMGITVPEQRLVARTYADLPLAEIKKLLSSKVHEHRLTALLILVSQFKSADSRMRSKLVKFYLANLDRVNNWDLVDSSARYILGVYLIDKDRKIVYKLATSQNIWHRRVAIVATQAFIAQNDFGDTLRLAEILLHDTHDLMHKATGWMLREVGKRSPTVLKKFLYTHAKEMPRTMLRYCIEKFPEAERKRYLKK
jgi:3-methyladenine DNA glycosylase AlkD